MLVMKTIVLCGILRSVWNFSFLPDGSSIVFDRFNGMCGGKIPVKGNFRITKCEKNVAYLNSTLTVTEDINEKLEIHIKMKRCRSKENLDTCEDFTEQKGLSYCPLIEPTIARLSPMFINYEPTFKCPFKKGVYRAVNSKLDLSVFTGFRLDGYYWRAKVNITTIKTKRLVQCFEADVYVKKTVNN